MKIRQFSPNSIYLFNYLWTSAWTCQCLHFALCYNPAVLQVFCLSRLHFGRGSPFDSFSFIVVTF